MTNKQPISLENPEAKPEELIASAFVEDLVAAAKLPGLTEDLALAILRRRDLPGAVLEEIARNHSVIKQRKVLLGVAEHQHTPRHISLPLLRRLFTFELMQLALTPSVLPDIKLAADEILTTKLTTLAVGERITLARRGSTKIAGTLLLDAETTVIEAALQNPRTTEASIVKALGRPETPLTFLTMLVNHSRWSLRREIQIGILRRREATEGLVLNVAAKLPKPVIQQLIRQAKLPAGRKELLEKALART